MTQGTKMTKNIHVLVIDPQNDFCDPKGSLYVNGADQDMDRLSILIEKKVNSIGDIHITMDSHRLFDVAHPIAWVDSGGVNHPTPFTVITQKDVEQGVWRASHPGLQAKWLEYVTKLQTNGRYPLCIWPPHCLIGTWGHNIWPKLYEATQKWESRFVGAMIDVVTKGSNPFTEHYSAVQSDVPDDNDPSTQLNTSLITTIQNADEIWLAGEALSHCVANTIRDIANNFGEDNIKKFIMLTDASSPVGGFESMADDFMKEMLSRGMRTASTVDLF